MWYAARSHIGLVRQVNEDGYAVHVDLRPWRLLLVADGMGGASAGEVASQLAVGEISSSVRQGIRDGVTDPAALLHSAVLSANQRIWEAAQSTPDYAGMGTTVVAVLAADDTAALAHVGDSRGYLLSGDVCRQMTQDHSLVAELTRRGQLSEEEAQLHPQRHIVTRSLGTVETEEPDVNVFTWNRSDVLLLCSDGLSGMLSGSEIADALHVAATAGDQRCVDRIADSLLQVVLDRGAPDNVTLILAVHREGSAR